MSEKRPAAEVIDEVRRDYVAGRIDRASAITHIQAQVAVTEFGAADLLDHEDSAQARYANGGDWNKPCGGAL